MKTKRKTCAVLTATTLGFAGSSFASSFGDEKYIYDASGNIVEKHLGDQITRFDYAGNQMNGSAGCSGRLEYQYDASGRLIVAKGDASSERRMQYQYLDKVTNVENDGNTTELYYNSEGQLVGKTTAGQNEVFAWDDLSLVMRGEQAYANEDHIVGGVPVLTNGEVIVSDYLGSTLGVGEYQFPASAFGEGLEDGMFTGKPFVEELGSFVFKFRNYLSDESRWATADPSGFPDGMNYYLYVLNRSTHYIDKMGLDLIHAIESTNEFSIECWADNEEFVGVTTILKATYDTIPSPHRSFVYSSENASGSNPSAYISPNQPWQVTVTGDGNCPSTCGVNFKNKAYTGALVEAYVQITSPFQDMGNASETFVGDTDTVHAEQ